MQLASKYTLTICLIYLWPAHFFYKTFGRAFWPICCWLPIWPIQNMMQKSEKWPKHWHMGTRLSVLMYSYLMNTYMTGFRWFLGPCALGTQLGTQVASALEGLKGNGKYCYIYIHKIYYIYSKRVNCGWVFVLLVCYKLVSIYTDVYTFSHVVCNDWKLPSELVDRSVKSINQLITRTKA